MNPKVLVTLAEAKAIQAKLLAQFPTLAGGAVPDDATADAPGIFVPTYGGPYSPPSNGDSRYYFFAWKTHEDPMLQEVGLVRSVMQYWPTRWPMALFAEYQASGAL